MSQQIRRGATVLIFSGFISKILGALFRLPLTYILGLSGVGVFQTVMSLYSLFLVLISGGIATVLSQKISSFRARGAVPIRQIFKSAFLFVLLLGAFIGIIFLIFGQRIAVLTGSPDGAKSYYLFFLLLPVCGFISIFRGIIQGYDNMTPTAVSQIIEQSGKFALGLLFAYICSSSAAMSVFGAFLGITAGEIFALIYLTIVSHRYIDRRDFDKTNFPCEIKPADIGFFKSLFPQILASLSLPLAHAFDASVIISRLSIAGESAVYASALFGLQTGVVGAVLNLPLVISMSVSNALLPKVSFYLSKGALFEAKRLITTALKSMWVLLLPMTLGISATSQAIYTVLYGDRIVELLSVAVTLTNLGAVSIIFTGLSQFFFSLLFAQNRFFTVSVFSIVGAVVKMMLVFTLASVSGIGIYALPISNIAYAIICSFSLIKLKKIIKIDYFSLFLPLFSSILMFFVVKILDLFNFSSIVFLSLSILLGAIVYILICLPVLKQLYMIFISKEE